MNVGDCSAAGPPGFDAALRVSLIHVPVPDASGHAQVAVAPETPFPIDR